MLPQVFLISAALFAVGAILIVLTHNGHAVEKSQRRGDWIKYIVYLGIINAILLMSFLGRMMILTVVVLIAVLATVEVYRRLKVRIRHGAIGSILFAVLISSALVHLVIGNGRDWPASFISIFFLVSINDSFAQLWGKLLGKHRLCPKISPAKTWEGFIGGVGSTLLGAMLLSSLMPENLSMGSVGPAGIGLTVALSGTAGDLFFSWIKRRLGIKDFSNLLPSHGGVLDRFDSLIVAAPVYYWVHKLLIL